MEKSKILKQGFVEAEVRTSGMLQKRKFRIDYENIVYGKLPVVVIDIILPMGELIGLAGKLDIALRSGPNLIIPPGRKERELVV